MKIYVACPLRSDRPNESASSGPIPAASLAEANPHIAESLQWANAVHPDVDWVTPDAEIPEGQGVRVLRLDLLPDAQSWWQAHAACDLPTLVILPEAWLASSAPPDWLSLDDDFADRQESSASLVARLRRLVSRSLLSTQSEGVVDLQLRDPLTQLLNRRGFDALVAQRLEAPQDGACLGLLFLDLDHFKMVNDAWGHPAGDAVLREAAGLFRGNAQEGDVIARLGGDEFVLLLERADRDALLMAAQGLVDRVARHAFFTGVTPNGESLKITASLGVCVVNFGMGVEAAMRAADTAMYEAKKRGRGRMVVADEFQELVARDGKDLRVQHLENVSRVVSERVTQMITVMASRMIAEATRDANEDALTGLRNRRYFNSQLEREVLAAARHGRALSMIFMDLDHFHGINANFGWTSGDLALKTFGEILNRCTRAVDTCVRYGGEEFCVLLPETDLLAALEIAERIRAMTAADQIKLHDGRVIALTVSIGVAQLGPQGSAETLLEQASEAARRAKQAGRNRVESCESPARS